MRTQIRSQTILVLIFTFLSLAALGKGGHEPITVMDETLTKNQMIDQVPFEAGTHVKVLEYKGETNLSSRTIYATRPGGLIKIGPIQMSGDNEVTINYGHAYFQTSASNIGDHITHHNIIQIREKGFTITGQLAQATRLAGVLLAGKDDVGFYQETGMKIQFFCMDEKLTGHCFQNATLENFLPIFGMVAEDTVLDGIPVLVGDTVFFQGDGHPASILVATRYLINENRHEYHSRPITVELMHKGVLTQQKIVVNEVTFTKHHRPSVISPSVMDRIFGIPLAGPQNLGNEALIIHPDGSFVLSIRPDAVFVYDGIPVGASGRMNGDLKFNSQGFLEEATLGGAIVYGGLLLKPGVALEFQEFENVNFIQKALLKGSYARYAYEGPYKGESQVFLLGADITFDRSGLVTEIEGHTIDDESLKEEYRRTDRIVYPVQGP